MGSAVVAVCRAMDVRFSITILLAGISTNVGVESTARDAYEQIFIEHAMAARSPDEHAHTIRTVFARIGRVRLTAEVLAALEVATRQA